MGIVAVVYSELLIKKALRGVNWGNRRRDDRILTPNELDLTFWVPNYGAKFNQNRVRIAT